MQIDVWQRLLSLESRDIVSMWFQKIHGLELNARRANEVTSAAMQSREYFRNASVADDSIKPLLTYYGVASLSRALVLLLKRDGGEEGLANGHGLETVDWQQTLSGDLSGSLSKINTLKVRTCSGLFNDLAVFTKNRMIIHLRSGGVDWRFFYPLPSTGNVLAFNDIIERYPDLFLSQTTLGRPWLFAYVSDIEIRKRVEMRITANTEQLEKFKGEYERLGYKFETSGTQTILIKSAPVLTSEVPQFLHKYVDKILTIPILQIVPPFTGGNRYSQLCILYALAFFLGMLSRYYPTHWIALLRGHKGDAWSPTLNRIQRCTEESFPELALKYIEDIVAQPKAV